MAIGPVLGVAGANAVSVLIESDREPTIEVREEPAPAKRTEEPGQTGWDGRAVEGVAFAPVEGHGALHRAVASGLNASRYYRYRVRTGTRIVGQGRFRPVAATASDEMGFILLSCNKPAASPPDQYAHMWRELARVLDEDPSIRFLIHAGDQVYCDAVWDPVSDAYRKRFPGAARQSEKEAWYASQTPGWRAGYRAFYEEAWSPDPVRTVLRSVPSMMLVDDHDIHDGYGSRGTDFWRSAPSLSRVAFEAYRQYQATQNPQPNLGGNNFGFATRLLGATFIGLDGRSQRDFRKNKGPQVLGAEQWQAFQDALDAHAEGPLFVTSGVPPFNLLLQGGAWRRVLKLLGSLGEAGDDLRDAWSSKPNRKELARLLAALDGAASRGVAPIVVLSGDIHVNHLGAWRRKQTERLVHQITASPFTNTPHRGFSLFVAYPEQIADKWHTLSPGYAGKFQGLWSGRGFAHVRVHKDRRVSIRYWLEPQHGGPLGPVPLDGWFQTSGTEDDGWSLT